MGKKVKWGLGLFAGVLLTAVVAFGVFWAWKYYWLSPEPDAKEYATIEQRA